MANKESLQPKAIITLENSEEREDSGVEQSITVKEFQSPSPTHTYTQTRIHTSTQPSQVTLGSCKILSPHINNKPGERQA